MLLSRVPTLDDLLFLRLPDPLILNRPRPEALRTAYQHFQAQEHQTLKDIDAILIACDKPSLRSSITLPLLRDISSTANASVPWLALNPRIFF